MVLLLATNEISQNHFPAVLVFASFFEWNTGTPKRRLLHSLLELITFGAWASFGLLAVTVGAQIEDPCDWLESGEAEAASLPVVIRDLKTRTHGLKMFSQETLSFISSSFSLDIERFEDIHFIPPIDDVTTEIAAHNATIDATSALLSHWSLLYKVLTHLYNVSNDGDIGQSANDGSNEGTLRVMLLEMKSRTERIVCDLKIGLNTLDTDTQTPVYGPSALFSYLGHDSWYEIHRAYIVTRECDMVMAHLNRIYSTMDEANN